MDAVRTIMTNFICEARKAELDAKQVHEKARERLFWGHLRFRMAKHQDWDGLDQKLSAEIDEFPRIRRRCEAVGLKNKTENKIMKSSRGESKRVF